MVVSSHLFDLFVAAMGFVLAGMPEASIAALIPALLGSAAQMIAARRSQRELQRSSQRAVQSAGFDQLRMPSCRARSTAFVRSRAASLVRITEMWFFTVPSARNSASAI